MIITQIIAFTMLPILMTYGAKTSLGRRNLENKELLLH